MIRKVSKANRTKHRMPPLKLTALILFCCISITMLFAQAPPAPAQPDSSAAKFPEANAYANTKLTYKVIDAPKHTYGYDVFADGRLMIHQTSVPDFRAMKDLKQKGCLNPSSPARD